MNPATIVITDTSSVFRRGIADLLEKHFPHCIITEAADANTLLCLMREPGADVILAPVNLLQQDSFNAVWQLLPQHNHVRVIMYAAHRDEQLIMHAFSAGAVAFFYWDEPEESILHKTEQVLQTGSCINTEAFYAFKLAHKQLLQTQQGDKIITPREKEILQLIEKGFSTQQVAAQLFIAACTVQNHRNNILRKTGCHNIAQALLYLKENGLY